MIGNEIVNENNPLVLWLMEMRLPFLVVSILPVFLGSYVARAQGARLNLFYFLMTIAGAVFVHLGANVINDYFDHHNDTDKANKEYVKGFTGGSRMIQDGLMSHKEVLAGSIIFLATGFAIILYFTFQFGALILLGGLAAVLSAVVYSMFAGSFYVGELLVAACFGLLIPAGAFYVQTHSLTPLILLPSIAPFTLVFLILFINEIPDCTADKLCGKKTLVVRIGRRYSAYLYSIVLALFYIYLIYFSKIIKLPAILLSLLTLPLAAYASAFLLKNYDEPEKLGPALKVTIVLYITNVLIITGAYAARGG